MFRAEDKAEIAKIGEEELKKEGKLITLLTRLFPVILKLAERIALRYLQKKGWI